VTEKDRANITALPEATLRHLHDLRRRLLHLHKTLLDMERADFERDFGRLNQIDEMLSAEEPATPNDARNLIAQARSLVISPADEVFREKYQAALQREPEVVMAHSEVAKLLREDQA
jgi:hypothetical protein